MGNLYVIKTKGYNQDGQKYYLSNQAVIVEKIAYDILALCGVRVPKTYLVEKKNVDGSVQLGIASEVEENFIILKNAIVEKYHTQEIEIDGQHIEHYEFIYKESFLKNGTIANEEGQEKPITGLYEALAGFAVIMDYDALGYVLTNAGFIERKDDFQFIKIDPGLANLGLNSYVNPDMQAAFAHFSENLDADLKNGMILKCFGLFDKNNLNIEGAKALFRLKEICVHATESQKLAGIIRQSYINKKHIEAVIKRKAYKDYLDRAELNEMVETAWERISAIQGRFQKEINEYFDQNKQELFTRIPPLPKQEDIRPIEDFLKSADKVTKGKFAPRVFIKLPEYIKKQANLKTSLLHQAVIEGDLREVQRLINEGAHVDARDRQGNTPLFYAIKIGRLEIAKFLLTHNAKKNALKADDSLLHMATKFNDFELFDLLVTKTGISPDSVDKHNRTPRDIAEKYHEDEILKWYNLTDEITKLSDLLERCQSYYEYAQDKFLREKKMQKEILVKEFINSDRASTHVKEFIKSLSPLRKLISDLGNELDHRKQNKVINEYEVYARQLNICQHKDVKTAVEIDNLKRDLARVLKDYVEHHRSFFGIHNDRQNAMQELQSLQENCVHANNPVKVFLGALIFQSNKATELHKKKSMFHFFTNSNLASALNKIISKYDIKPDQLENYCRAYQKFKI